MGDYTIVLSIQLLLCFGSKILLFRGSSCKTYMTSGREDFTYLSSGGFGREHDCEGRIVVPVGCVCFLMTAMLPPVSMDMHCSSISGLVLRMEAVDESESNYGGNRHFEAL